MERNLFKYIWRHSWRDQVYILVIVALLQVFYFISLDLPKRIVNDGIRGEAFREPRSRSQLIYTTATALRSAPIP